MELKFHADLNGKTAIVTGGSGTLCSCMAEALAMNGAKVAIIGRGREKLDEVAGNLQAKGLQVKGFCADVCKKDTLIAAYEEIKKEFGTCDILINGAGGNTPDTITPKEYLGPEMEEGDDFFWNMDEDAIRGVMDLNYLGTMLPIMVFTKDMVKNHAGSIINIASVAGAQPLTKVVAYGNMKCSIINLTQWLAVHLGESGVRCNAIAPGFYAAKQNHDLLFNPDESPKPRAKKIIAHTPMRRFGKPEDLAGAAVFLASDASAFVNGILLPVDGGFLAYSGV